jgi:general secretion pathway protein K
MRLRQQGVVLVLVLWALVLLVVVVSAVSSSVHTESTLAHHQLDQARFRAVADAAFYYGAARGFDPDAEHAWSVDGEPYEWHFNGVDLEIRLIKERLRIDLNQATAQQIKVILDALEIDPERQGGLTDAILDWRDKDSLHRLNGAEDEQYQEAGRPYGAKDAPFTTVDEIGLVLGFDAQLKNRLLPYLSVSSASAQIKFSPLSVGFGVASGVRVGNGLWVQVFMPTERQPYLAEALVRQSGDRLSLDKINYRVSPATWPFLEDEE